MANDDNLSYEITADGRQARKEIRSVYDLLAKISPVADKAGKSLDEVGAGGLKELRNYASTLERVDALLDNLETRQARNASMRSTSAANATLAQSNAKYGDSTNQSRAQLAAQRAMAAEEQRTISLRQQANRDLESESRIILQNAQIERVTNQQRIDNIREAERAQRSLARAQEQAARAAQRAEAERQRQIIANARTERSSALAAERAAQAQAAFASGAQSGPRHAATIDAHDVTQINATRYALYDVAQTATLAGTAIVGIGGAALAAATTSQAAFADVQRAMDVPFEQAKELRGQLMDLTTEMPTSFTDVAGAAQLGAQLGVANEDLDNFTESVVKFAATTDVSVEAAGTAFGRLGQLLDVPASAYENLSSSIYQVGIDSVATESEIISTSTQIAGAASAYNFTADQVVGLSAAFASLGIAPEAARGSITRIFGDIEKAVGTGGSALRPFLSLLGETEEQATKLWKSDPSAFFSKLVDGLSKSDNLLNDLSSIGANDVRDINLLQRLASNSDFLAKSLKTAKDAYDDGTATSRGYAVTAETLQAKLQELLNTFVKLGDAAGGPFLAALGVGVDVLKNLLTMLTNTNPVILSVLTAITLFVGGFLLLRGAQAAAMAAMLAFRFVLQQLGETAGVTGINFASMRAQLALLRTELGGTAAAAATTNTTIAATGTATQTAGRGMQFLGAASKAVGWASLILLAGQLTGAILEANRASINLSQGINLVSNSGANAKLTMNEVADSFKQAKDQIYEFEGGNITDQVAKFFGGLTGVTDYVTQAQEEVQKIDDRLANMVATDNGEEAARQVAAFGISANEAATLLPGYTKAVEDADNATQNKSVTDAIAAGNMDDYKSATDAAKDSVDGLFTSLNAQSDFASSIQTLFSGIYDAGNAFTYLSEAGRTNLSNLQDAIAQTIVFGQTMGISASDSIVMVFQQLAAAGVNTDSLIRTIANQPYMFSADIDISAVQKKLAALGTTGMPKNATSNYTTLNTAMKNLAISAPKAKNGLSGTGTAAKKAGKQAKDAAKEVKTLSDYASDLGSVFSDASKYRFGVQDALDDIEGKWVSINKDIDDNNKALADHQKDIADAREELAKYRSELAGLRADLDTKEYFLKVAIQYGDTLRANEIGADIIDARQQIADKQKDIAKANADVNAPFDNTTKSQLEQRKSLGDLYEAYQKAIEEYARSGMTQDQLRVKVEELRKDFVRQAEQAGYSKQEIDRYSQAFRDLTTVINGVPRKITVTANTDPAMQALNDFLAKANAAKASAKVDAPGAGGAGAAAADAFTDNFDAGMQNWNSAWNATKAAINSIADTVKNLTKPRFDAIGMGIPFYNGRAKGGFIPGENAFPIGGFVPGPKPQDLRKDNVLAMGPSGMIGLQGGEAIMTNAARSKYGDQLFNDINSLRFSPQIVRPQVTVQGGNSGMLELSPYDRQLLIDIRNASGLSLSATAMQKAANAGNTTSSRRRQG